MHIGTDAKTGYLTFDELLKSGTAQSAKRVEELAPTLQFDDPINIQFTSGTTGAPKGATLSHHNILNNGFFIGETMKLTDQDTICIPVPLYHCFAWCWAIWPA